MGCGVTAHVTPTPSGLKVAIEGDVNHPANYGKLCIKGSNLADTLGLETRVLEPIIGRKDQQEITSWDTATSIISKNSSNVLINMVVTVLPSMYRANY